MTGLTALWLPILLSAVLVFLASSVIHMFTPWHKGDYLKVPNEDKAREAIRALNLAPGDYCLPRPDSTEEMKTPEFQARYAQGPNVMMTVLPSGPMNMGRSLGLWFVYLLVIGVFAAYVSGRALPSGTDYLRVFRFAGVTAFAGYALGIWQMTIWYYRSVGTTIRSTLDGLLYACLTAGVFGWLWPR
jgi:hypothetical protein